MNDHTQTPSQPIDWRLLHSMIPWLVTSFAFVMWAMFLLIPTLFGIHNAVMFSALNNASYALSGLTLCFAAFRAAKANHGVHTVVFAFSVLVLSYWF